MTVANEDPGAGAGAGDGAGTPAAGAGEPAAGGGVIDALLGGGEQKPAGEGAGEDAWWKSEAYKLSADKADGETLSDADWLANKGFKSFEDAMKAYRGLEAQFGKSKLPVPKGADDAEALDAIAKALGRPDDPKGYEIPLPEGDDGSFAESFRPIAHELRLSQEQVKGLASWFNGLSEADAKLNADAAGQELRGEWKDKFSENQEFARRGAETFKLDNAALEKIASGYGLANTIKLMAELGRATGEGGGLVQGDGRPGLGKSPEQLAARKAEILASPELSKKLYDGDPGLKAEWDAINAAEAAELDAKLRAA